MNSNNTTFRISKGGIRNHRNSTLYRQPLSLITNKQNIRWNYVIIVPFFLYNRTHFLKNLLSYMKSVEYMIWYKEIIVSCWKVVPFISTLNKLYLREFRESYIPTGEYLWHPLHKSEICIFWQSRFSLSRYRAASALFVLVLERRSSKVCCPTFSTACTSNPLTKTFPRIFWCFITSESLSKRKQEDALPLLLCLRKPY